MFIDEYMKKLGKFENIINYISSYQKTYNKMTSLVKKGLYINMQIIELLLQTNIVHNLGFEYLRLVFLIQNKQKKEITNFANTILKIVCYKKILKESNLKILLTS